MQQSSVEADHETIDRVVPEWLRTEEFGATAGWSAPEVARIVGDLAGLARRAKERGDKLYCWVCV